MKTCRYIFLIGALLVSASTSAAGIVMGYATVDPGQGTANGYNSSGGGLFLRSPSSRRGHHQVFFEGLVSHDTHGYFQAVRVGSNSGFCKVQSVRVTGGTWADVQCYESYGAPATDNHPFNLLYLAATGTNDVEHNFSYFYAKKSAEPMYEPGDYLAFNSDRGKIFITRNGLGKYTATVPGMGSYEPTAVNVQLSTIGAANSICTLGGWERSESMWQALEIKIQCFDPYSENPRDSAFQALVVRPGGLPEDFAYTYSTNSGHSSVPTALLPFYTHTSVPHGSVTRGSADHIVISPIGRAFGSISLISPLSFESRICQITSSDIRLSTPRPAIPPYDDLIINPLCTTTTSGGVTTDAYSLLTIAAKETNHAPKTTHLMLEILHIDDHARFCPGRFYFDPISISGFPGLSERSESLWVGSDATSDKPLWKYTVELENNQNTRMYLHLKKSCSFFGRNAVDIIPTTDQRHLTIEVDLRSRSVTSINNDWLFPEFLQFGYIGETLTVHGTEFPLAASIRFRVTTNSE